MNNINKRFLRDLFIEKKVLINNDLYAKIYDHIWPCEELFVEFLRHTDPTLKLDFAKKIYSFIQSNNDIFLPVSLINNIIEFQNSNLVDNISRYVPQDHIVHCVNLYITGIYIFFNNELFNNKLVRGISITKSITKRYKDFADKWLLFSFYHDIGYYLEGSINNKGIYNDKYKEKISYYESEVLNEFIYLCTTRIVSRLITIAATTHKTEKKFCSKDIENIDFVSKTAKTPNKIEDYNGAVLIQDFHKFEDECILQHIFKHTKSMTISYTNDHDLICILLRNYGKNECLLINRDFKSLFDFDYTKIEKCIEVIKEFPCNHYVMELDNVFDQYGETLFTKLSTDFFEKLPQKLKEEYVFMPSINEIKSYFNHINEWIISNLKPEYLKKDVEYIHEDLLSSCYKDVFVSTISNYAKAVFEKYKENKISYDKINEYTTKVINELDAEIIEKDIYTTANKEYEELHGSFIDIADFSIITYNELINHLYSKENKKSIESLRFIEHHFHNKISIEPFSYNKKISNSVEEKLFNELCSLSNKMKIDFSDLTKYKTSYSTCDHGVISACLLFQIIVMSFKINEGCENYVKFDLLWNKIEDKNFVMDDANVSKYADVIFAILLHNIYTKNSADYGINYKQDIDINPFSYFGAYCDTIQKWNRPKQIDLSKTYLPDSNYLNDLFDIELKNNKIYLKCYYKDLNQMNHTISGSEDFLPGITKFTKVKEIED